MSLQTLFEVCLGIAFFVVVPGLLLALLNPVLDHANRSKLENQVTLSYFADGRRCSGECIANELQGGRGVSIIDLSIVIPAYNEEARLPVMLGNAVPFLQDWSTRENKTYEIVVSDDYSSDGTKSYVLGVAATDSTVRLLSLGRNCGKGGAVRRGVQYARGRYILMADADGATDMADLTKLWDSLQSVERVDDEGDRVGISVGSRAHMEKDSIATRSWVRTVLMHGFHFLVTLLCTRSIRDTQCGFKLFTRKAARLLFSNLHLEGWTFDIEIIYMAEQLGIPISEVAVRWHEVDGSKLIQSKLDIVVTSLKMARDMACLRLAYLTNMWKVNPHAH